MREGYKQTEIGWIPEDWESGCFGEFMCGFTSGMTPFRGRKEYYNGSFPWITSGELNYNIIKDTNEKISIEAIRKTNLKIVPKGTFLIAITGLEAEGTRGSCAITGIEATTNQSCMALYPFPHKLTTPFLFHYYVRFGKELALKYCQGTKQQSYNGATAKKLPIFFPKSLPEQQAIAEALSDADAWIESLEALLQKKRLIKQGAMQELLRPKEGWEVKKLGDIGEIFIGLTYSPRDVYDFGTLVLRSSNIQNSKLAFDDCVFVQMELPNRVIVKEDDLLICVRNGSRELIGKCALINRKTSGQAFGAFMSVFRSEFNKFIFFQFQSEHIQKQIEQNIGATINQITNKMLAAFEVYFPPIKEQTLISTILSDMDNEIEALEQKLFKARQIKQGMMQQLLTGQIGLVKPAQPVESDTVKK